VSDEERQYEELQLSVAQSGVTCFRRGTIIYINKAENWANVLIDNIGLVERIPIFYHCECTYNTSDGYAAFMTEDEEAVNHYLYWGNSRALLIQLIDGSYKIISFEDGVIRPCFLCRNLIINPAETYITPTPLLVNMSTVTLEAIGGCPPLKWAVYNPHYGGDAHHILGSAYTEGRTNTLYVHDIGMQRQQPSCQIFITNKFGETLECHTAVICPKEASMIVEPFPWEELIESQQAIGKRTVIIKSSDENIYFWQAENGWIHEGTKPNILAGSTIDHGSHVCFTVGLGLNCTLDEWTVDGKISMICLAHPDGEGRIMDEYTLAAAQDPPEIIYDVGQMTCGDSQIIGTSPPTMINWIVTDALGTTEYHSEPSVEVIANDDNINCGNNINVIAICGGIEIANINIAVTCYTDPTRPAWFEYTACWYVGGPNWWHFYRDYYNCDGEWIYQVDCMCRETADINCKERSCYRSNYCILDTQCPYNYNDSPIDLRSGYVGTCYAGPNILDDSCCPEELM
jgi:hypothetical protein